MRCQTDVGPDGTSAEWGSKELCKAFFEGWIVNPTALQAQEAFELTQ